jgi:signal transduction histidine kinase
MDFAGAEGNGFPIELEISGDPRSGASFAAESRLLEMVASGCSLPTVAEAPCRCAAQRDTLMERYERFLAQAQALSATGSFAWRLATGEISCSGEFYRIFSIDSSLPVTYSLILSRVHPEDRPNLVARLESRAIEYGDIAHDFRLLMPDHAVTHVRMAAHATRDPHAGWEYIVAVQDVTEHRLCEEALREARAELAYAARVASLGTLSASIAHEVKQPLSGIITNASTCLRMLASDPPDLAGARETAKRTLRDGNRASDVITRLRALFTKKTVSGETVNLNQVAQEALTVALGDLQCRRVSALTELADEVPTVQGDRIQLHQVILNLILNAADAMGGIHDHPRRMKICTQLDGANCVVLSVQDTGTGIGTDAARLFEPFYTTKIDGMGMGLSISRDIITRHGGRLWATPNEGPGATFCFSVPCAPQNIGPPPSVSPSHRGSAVPGRISLEDRRAAGMGL